MNAEAVLHFVQYDLQAIALTWMAVMYSIKVYQMWRLPMPWEKAPRKGDPLKGVLSSYATTFFPWLMESSRRHIWRWLEFAVYHLGAAAAIFATFSLPFAPALMVAPVRYLVGALTISAAVLGLTKLHRRVSRPELRLVSTPDDYFSLVTLEVFFISASVVMFADAALSRTVFFVVTAAFLFYVPFSKISHYVYYFLAGVVTGTRYGFRGVRPAARRAQ